jgi:hypothetical protein
VGAGLALEGGRREAFRVAFADVELTGTLQPGLGVAHLDLGDGMTTPEGIGVATVGEILAAAYPDATIDDPLVIIRSQPRRPVLPRRARRRRHRGFAQPDARAAEPRRLTPKSR